MIDLAWFVIHQILINLSLFKSFSVKRRRNVTLYPHQKNKSALSHGAVMPTTIF